MHGKTSSEAWQQRYDETLDKAYALGAEHGRAAASWYFGPETTRETYARVLLGILECDPQVFDTFPAGPLSGEWAGDPVPATVLAEVGHTGDDDDADAILCHYEDGYGVAVVDEIERVCRFHLAPEPGDHEPGDDDDDDDTTSEQGER